MIATWPASRSVTAKKSCQSRLCCGSVGRWLGGTKTFQVSFIWASDISGATGGSFCRNFAMLSACACVSTPCLPQSGIPRGVPLKMIAASAAVPFGPVLSGVRAGPVAPLRSVPWQPAQRSKKTFFELANSASASVGATAAVVVTAPAGAAIALPGRPARYCTTMPSSWSLNAFASVAGISPFWHAPPGQPEATNASGATIASRT